LFEPLKHGSNHAMPRTSLRNLHVPLPATLHQRLRAEATRSGRPATTLARDAIEAWIREREREQVSDHIAEYAAQMAGSAADLDPVLERAAIDRLRHKRRKR
jgi:predicted DNA-binding protein